MVDKHTIEKIETKLERLKHGSSSEVAIVVYETILEYLDELLLEDERERIILKKQMEKSILNG